MMIVLRKLVTRIPRSIKETVIVDRELKLIWSERQFAAHAHQYHSYVRRNHRCLKTVHSCRDNQRYLFLPCHSCAIPIVRSTRTVTDIGGVLSLASNLGSRHAH